MERAVELDQQSVGRDSRIDALQMQAMSQAEQRRRAARRVAIQQALKRIEIGEFAIASNAARQSRLDDWMSTRRSRSVSDEQNEAEDHSNHWEMRPNPFVRK